VSKYLELARRAATREERRETAGSQIPSRGSVYPPISESPTLAHKMDDSYREPDDPARERDKSDISDQSSDHRAVVEVLRDPPYWLRDSYMVGYRRGTLSLHALSAAVAAALGRSPHAWAKRLKPVVDQVFKQQEATDVDVYSAKSREHAKEGGRGL
jgi:hypothetical protein